MKFTRLRVLGFKSFVEPTDFVIERGLTGVVGPNGCGKSNLVEALRWVMGESSYKNMRASGMDDVIFSGSGTRPARNTAEVALFLDNRDRTAPAAFNDADELQVSRRIEREAGSLYRINGKEARAKDVQLLFADQSTGARSPSMVGQGRIGELIQAKPQARRALLEEAAGISGLHSRRHEAELRLRGAEQNLERLDDVVGELQVQIDSLRRQARQAQRFRNLSAEIRQAEAVLMHLRWTQAKEQEAEARAGLSAATSLVAERAAAQAGAAKEQAVAAHGLPALREAQVSAAAALQRLNIARGQLEEEAGRVRTRVADLAKRIAQLDADIAREHSIRHDNAGAITRLDEEERAIAAESAEADERKGTLQAALDEAAARLASDEAGLAAATAARADAAAQRAQGERSLREAQERRVRLERQLAEVDRDLAEVQARLAELADPAGKRMLVEDAEADLAGAEEAVLSAEAAVAEARASEAAARRPLADARAELSRVETEARTLAGMLAAAAGGKFPSLLERLGVERGFETALGAALGEDIDMPLDPAAPAHWAMPGPSDTDPALPEGARRIADLVRAPPQLSRRLAQVGIVELADGPRLQTELRPGQTLVTKDGALWRWDGFVATADAPTAAALRLAQKNRLAELKVEAEAAAAYARDAETALALSEQRVRAAAEAERNARDARRRIQATLDTARAEWAKAERAAGELSTRLEALMEARDRQADSLAEAAAAQEEAEHVLTDAPDLGDLQRQFEAATAAVAQARARAMEARSAHDELRRGAEAHARRLAAIADERHSWSERVARSEAQSQALAERRAEAGDEFEALATAPDEIEARRRRLDAQVEEAERLRKAAADTLQAAENRQTTLDRLAGEAVQALAQAREARARAEERLTAADDRRREIEARIAESMNVAPHLLLGHAEIEPGTALPDAGELERRIERLRLERERLGAVNLRAEEEQHDLSGRLDTIVAEREDVIEAIRRLRQAIQNLNREGRERLVAAFDVVNEQFRRLFTHLFGGGTAELQLIESDDPLEAGLEIVARPPGKKPQTMTLLSGGEQALTAMALIFAVFLTNPAPVCVLDEVDAPLDDHNVERFCNLMDEMAATTETRFIIITHNPITMARMNRLFGVTMAEQGVSQLVSVDLQTAEQLREAS